MGLSEDQEKKTQSMLVVQFAKERWVDATSLKLPESNIPLVSHLHRQEINKRCVGTTIQEDFCVTVYSNLFIPCMLVFQFFLPATHNKSNTIISGLECGAATLAIFISTSCFH